MMVLKRLLQQFPEKRDERPSALRKEDHPLFRLYQANREDHRQLLEQFELVEGQLDANKLELPITRWRQDKEEITQVLGCGRKYGETLVGSVLAPRSTMPPSLDRLGKDEPDRVIRGLFKGSRELLDGETWGQVAEDQLKQFSALARTVQSGKER
jgi:hypothetical protein